MTQIPEEALPRFLAELPNIIAEARRYYDAMDEVAAALGFVAEDDPQWVDDDLNQVTVSMTEKGEDEPFMAASFKRKS